MGVIKILVFFAFLCLVFIAFATFYTSDANGFAAAGTANVTANVIVSCPFVISSKSQSLAIQRYGNFFINYSIKPIVNCTVPEMKGSLGLYLNNMTLEGNVIQLKTNAFNKEENYNQSINSSNLALGNYTARIDFSNSENSNVSYSIFKLFEPANLSLENFSIQSPVGVGSNLLMYFDIVNKGNYSPNDVYLHVNITGAENITQQIYNISGGPSSENISLEERGLTVNSGTYKAIAYATYKRSVSSNAIFYTNRLNATYVVKPPSPKTPSIPVVPVPKIPKVSITTVLFHISSAQNTSVVSNIGLSNPSNQTEMLNLSVPSYLSDIVKLSTGNLTLSPGSNVSVSIYVNSRNLTPGIYNIPINVTATIANKTTSRTDYIQYSVSNRKPNAPIIYTNVELRNNTEDGYVIISISTPNNVTITNGTAITYLPQGLVPNQTYIDAYGIPNNITEQDGHYYVEWHISKLAPNQDIYAYVYVKKPSSQLLLANVTTSIFTPTTTSTSILRLLDLDSPIFTVGRNGTTTAELLYTGSVPLNITFTLTGPQYMRIYNASQTVRVVPNQIFYVYFNQLADSTPGTSSERLVVSFTWYLENYSTPLIVLAAPQTTTIATTTIAPSALSLALDSLLNDTHKYLVFVIGILIAVILGILYYLYSNKPHYNRERVESIKRIKSEIRNRDGK